MQHELHAYGASCVSMSVQQSHVWHNAHLAGGLGASAGGLALHIRGSALCLASGIISCAGDLVQNAAQVGGSVLSLHSIYPTSSGRMGHHIG